MAKSSDDRSFFLRTLADYPYVYYAAKKSGISPATIYRWMKSNPEFAREVRKLKREGLSNQNEKVEMVLVKKALEGNVGAIKFYLPHNSKKYRPMKPELPPPPISSEERESFRVVYEWALRKQPLPPDVQEEITNAWKNWGFIDGNGNVTQKFLDDFGHLTKDWENAKKKP